MVLAAETEVRARWYTPEADIEAEQKLAEALGLPRLVCASLIARGFRHPEDASAFLNPSLDQLHEPTLLPDCDAAVKEILLAKDRGETIYIHGDYDVDGVTSTAIWARSLSKLGFQVKAHVPHRMKEGYGIHESAVDDAIASGAKVFLTCDCGSSAVENVAKAREAGMRVVVTDHHELGSDIPEAHALVNPRRPDSKYPFPYLCGAGVAFKVAQAVAEECGAPRDKFIRAYLDLVCLGTIADIVPLIGENRILAAFGLKAIAESNKKGIRALISVCDIKLPSGITPYDVGWKLAPRINAVGRMDDAEYALQLMLTEDEKEAKGLADRLNAHNQDRREEEHRILAQVEEMILDGDLHKRSLIFVAAPGWHKGVVGLAAGRMSEKYFRPTLVGCIDDENGLVHGSARNRVPAFQLHEALMKFREMFNSCGGHAKAAGFSLNQERFEEIREALITHADGALQPEDLIPVIIADSEACTDELNLNAFRLLQKMAPFGQDNADPTFIVRGCTLTDWQLTANPEHVKFAVQCKRGPMRGIAFGMGKIVEQFRAGDKVDMVVEACVEPFNGYDYAKLQLIDIRKAES